MGHAHDLLTAHGAAMWSATIIGMYGLLSSLEDIVHCKTTFGSPGLLNWNIAQLNWRWLYRGLSGRFINAVLAYPNIHVLLWVRLLVSARLALTVPIGVLPPALVWMLFLCEIALFVRNRMGQDGSRQMALIVLLYLVVVATFPTSRLLQVAAPGYAGAQLVLAYWFSGFAKLVSRTWRSGDAFRRIMSTKDYGNQVAYEITTRYSAVSYLVCWLVILSELMFVAVILVPPSYTPYLVSFGVLFHGAIAVVMGLNLFFFSFLAAYPPLVFSLLQVRTLISA